MPHKMAQPCAYRQSVDASRTVSDRSGQIRQQNAGYLGGSDSLRVCAGFWNRTSKGPLRSSRITLVSSLFCVSLQWHFFSNHLMCQFLLPAESGIGFQACLRLSRTVFLTEYLADMYYANTDCVWACRATALKSRGPPHMHRGLIFALLQCTVVRTFQIRPRCLVGVNLQGNPGHRTTQQLLCEDR